MSPTTTQTQTQNAEAQAPNITIITRVTSIPMISCGLDTINDALTTNAYTRFPYIHAKALSNTAFKLTGPIQNVLAPIIVRVDGIANMAVDVVESRYPYPFKAKPEEVAALARQGQKNTTDYVNKAIDEKVKTPAFNVAHDIDQRFAPVVDYFEIAVCRLNGSQPSTPSDTRYQYQRALALSKTLGDNLYVYSNDQLKHIQAQSVMVQKASETAQSITAAASSSLASAQSRVTTLSDNMLVELDKLQKSAASLTASLQTTFQNSASQIQSQIPQIQQSYTDLSAALSSTANELTSIMTKKDIPLQEKVSRVGKEVRERIQPLLEAVKKGVSDVLARSERQIDANVQNGNGHGGQ